MAVSKETLISALENFGFEARPDAAILTAHASKEAILILGDIQSQFVTEMETFKSQVIHAAHLLFAEVCFGKYCVEWKRRDEMCHAIAKL